VIQEGEWLSRSTHYWMLRAYQELYTITGVVIAMN
jgi:hypothetical protein